MAERSPRPHSLVLYKNRPALVVQVGDKLEIALPESKSVKVRSKDVALLHPGPLRSLADLEPQTGEVEAAWELLIGETSTLAELAELVYGDYTPATAWAAWELVADGLYFQGSPDAVVARLPHEVTREQAARQARLQEAQAWSDFLTRLRAGQILPDDKRFLREVEELALERRLKSRVMAELGRSETPQEAHALLLELGVWDETVNPYPQRLGVTTMLPLLELPPLPEEKRVDLTHLPTFAIDDEGNQDPDDALSLDGNRLWVHVADVAALVGPDTTIDLEARSRGATLYLPEQTIPMLPFETTQRLGLGLADISPALSFGLEIKDAENITLAEVVPSWVRVHRFTYSEVEDRLAQEPFQSLYRLAKSFQAYRAAHEAITIELPEIKIRVVSGQVMIHSLPALGSRDLVQEAMLMAGQAVARFALAQGLPFPFATQEAPEEGQFPNTVAGMFARRRTLKRSQLKSVPAPHAGMGLDIYSQVTSPLRRYADLVAHQQLRAYLRGEKLLTAPEMLERLGAAEAAGGLVRQTERLARRHWTLIYLRQHPRWRGEGILVDKRDRRSLLLIPELDLEPTLHLREDLPLDSTLPIILNGVNLPQLEAYFQLAA